MDKSFLGGLANCILPHTLNCNFDLSLSFNIVILLFPSHKIIKMKNKGKTTIAL